LIQDIVEREKLFAGEIDREITPGNAVGGFERIFAS
jgi:hypothetical protein